MAARCRVGRFVRGVRSGTGQKPAKVPQRTHLRGTVPHCSAQPSLSGRQAAGYSDRPICFCGRSHPCCSRFHRTSLGWPSCQARCEWAPGQQHCQPQLRHSGRKHARSAARWHLWHCRQCHPQNPHFNPGRGDLAIRRTIPSAGFALRGA